MTDHHVPGCWHPPPPPPMPAPALTGWKWEPLSSVGTQHDHHRVPRSLFLFKQAESPGKPTGSVAEPEGDLLRLASHHKPFYGPQSRRSAREGRCLSLCPRPQQTASGQKAPGAPQAEGTRAHASEEPFPPLLFGFFIPQLEHKCRLTLLKGLHFYFHSRAGMAGENLIKLDCK